MTTQVQELLDGVKTGRWLLPTPDLPNPVSMARAISGICGGRSFRNDPVAEQLRTLIGEPKHLVFVIADGFGMNFVNMLSEDSFMRRNLAVEGRAVFPSSTGANLFAYARGQWPGQHGKLGWYVYLPELGERATLFPWERTSDGKDLADLGLSPESVFPGEPFSSNFERDSTVFAPDYLADSIPTRSMHGTESIVGYADLPNAVNMIGERISSSADSTYTHLYWPNVDSVAHGNGTHHGDTIQQLRTFDSEMQRLKDLLPVDARIVITADHGHADSPKNRRFRIDPTDELSRMLESEPSGESRIQYFRVKTGFKDRFADLFRERFGDFLFLFTTDDVLELELLGPLGISSFVRERLGDYLAVTKGPYSIEFCVEGDERMLLLESTHGGLLPDEMLVPIVIS